MLEVKEKSGSILKNIILLMFFLKKNLPYIIQEIHLYSTAFS